MCGPSLPLTVGAGGVLGLLNGGVVCLSSGRRCRSHAVAALGLGLDPPLVGNPDLHALCSSYSSAEGLVGVVLKLRLCGGGPVHVRVGILGA